MAEKVTVRVAVDPGVRLLWRLAERIRGLFHHLEGLGVEVSFETPTEVYIQQVLRPTIDFFLFDICENTERRETSMAGARGSGRAELRMARRIDLNYLVSVLTTDVADEHDLLWEVLLTVLENPELLTSEQLPGLSAPVVARVAQPDDQRRLDLWNALGATPRPALTYVVTAPADLQVPRTAPLVRTREFAYRRGAAPDLPPEVRTRVGVVVRGVVRDAAHRPLSGLRIAVDGREEDSVLTDDAGRYSLSDINQEEALLHLTRPDGSTKVITVHVPSKSYDLTWE